MNTDGKHIIELFNDEQGQHRVRIFAPNGEIIFTNAQGIANKKDLVQMLTNFLEAIRQGEYKIEREKISKKEK